MKGPYENNKVYAIAGDGRQGVLGGVIPAVYAYDTRTDENRFFTIGQDQAAEAANRDDVLSEDTVGELMLDSGEDAGWRVPERQVLSTWSVRDEALETHRVRSERAKAAIQLAKDRKRAAAEARLRNEQQAHEDSAEGRIGNLPGIMSVHRIMRGEKDKVFITLHMSPERFKKLAQHIKIPVELVEEFLAESKQKIEAEG